MQVWLANADYLRLQHVAKKSGRSQSEIAREGILKVLKEVEKEFENERERIITKDLFKRFSAESQKIIVLAVNEAETKKAPLVGSEHLLLALAVDEGRTGKLMSKFGLSYSVVRAKISSGWPSIYTVVANPPYSPTLVRILDRARLIAKRRLDKYVQPEHLLLSVLEQGTGFGYNILELVLGRDRSEIAEAIRKQMTFMRTDRRWKRKR